MSRPKIEELKQEYLFLDNPVRESDPERDPSLYFAYCGYEACRPGHSYGPYARTNYVIHVIRRGKGTLVYNKKRCIAEQGQMFILMPGLMTTYQADVEEPWDYCWIGFRGPAAERIVREIGFSPEQPVLDFRNVEDFSDIIGEMLQLRKRVLTETLKRQAYLFELMAMLIENADLCGIRRNVTDDTDLSYANYALQYIQKNFQNKIRVADIAEHIGISRGYLTRLIKEATGQSPQEYLIGLRLEHASRFLRHSQDPVRDVAFASGYSDSLAFSKAFKQHYGMSPSEYHRMYYREDPETGENAEKGDS